MKKIEIVSVRIDNNTLKYTVKEDQGLAILQNDQVEVFIKFESNLDSIDLKNVPESILYIPIFLYLLPITYFFNVELKVPFLDQQLYENLTVIYNAYSKIYGPFKTEWKGKISVNKIEKNDIDAVTSDYNKIVFFSGGVDAYHAGINNSGPSTLLVSIPDIEREAELDGPLRKEKYELIKNFSKISKSNWLLISSDLNYKLLKETEIRSYLSNSLKLNSDAYKYDGWGGIRYLGCMCSVAPIAYLLGIKSLIMGSAFEQIEDQLLNNDDGASPLLSDSFRFSNISFAEQDGLMIRRSTKVRNVIDWYDNQNAKAQIRVCFSNTKQQCSNCVKCVRTQLNLLISGKDPRDWGFENFNERNFTKFIKKYKYQESNPCWIWDNIDSIRSDITYPYCNDLLHWLKSLGYKKYFQKSNKYNKLRKSVKRLKSIHKYPQYIKVIGSKLSFVSKQ